MTSPSSWQPSSSIETLRQRAQITSKIRQFFAQREVWEVETPALSHHGVTDVHLSAFKTDFLHPQAVEYCPLFLQTSPEFAMKRLLVAGSGSIFQLSKAFRNEEAGSYHNPEFSMLEWYRTDFDHWQLIDEVDALLQYTLATGPLSVLTYQDAFIQYCGFDPLEATIETVCKRACELGFELIAHNEQDIDVLLQLLCCECIEPNIGREAPVALVGFPASQAALARLEPSDPRVARRFEVYFRGIELANGYHELSDSAELKQRFERDNQTRLSKGKQVMAIDPCFIEAMDAGMPECAGVALGIDRLMMLALNKSSITDVVSFAIDRA